ncbi:IncFII RepA protein family protein [compost metagenome]
MFTNYVSNPTPAFVAPTHQKMRSDFIHKLYVSAASRKVWLWEGFYAIQPIDPVTHSPIHRQRRFNLHRSRAIQAITIGIIYHLDVASGIAQISVEALSRQCGVSSQWGAISRASRAIITLEQYGVLKCEKDRGRTAGRAQKRIEITPYFIAMCGIEPEEFSLAQNAATAKADRL